MKPGKLALLRFPQVNLEQGKLRPVLLIARVPGEYADWLVAMVSSHLEQAIADFDEVIKKEDTDFSSSGLKQSSVIRIGRLAVANTELLLGTIGEISSERLIRIRHHIVDWVLEREK